ncbi:MAG: hypothetical protein KKD74_08335 [Bacteroidetes bacterium]|nr:hypothetical protein [Bacteroidales bacterium]MBU1010126.1 hypothetical protein [Bacteroidota bacterium]
MTGTSLIPVFAAVLVAARRKRIIRQFITNKALSELTAKSVDEIFVKPGFLFRRLVSRQIIVETHGKYYLDENRLAAHQQWRRMVLLPIVLLMVLAFLLIDIFLIS